MLGTPTNGDTMLNLYAVVSKSRGLHLLTDDKDKADHHVLRWCHTYRPNIKIIPVVITEELRSEATKLINAGSTAMAWQLVITKGKLI